MKYGILGVLFATMILAFSGLAEARSGYLSTFNGQYGTASTRLDTCDSCHVSGGKSRNPFGLDVEAKMLAGNTTSQALTAVEPLDSDGDSYNNLTELNALTFPGDPNDKPGTVSAPAIGLSPTALSFGTVTIGGSVTKTTLIQNSGSAGLDVTGIAFAAGTSTEYTSSPAAPFTVAPGSSTTLSVTYSPVDATTDNGSVEIQSNDNANPVVSLSLTGAGVAPQPQVIDIDISSLTVTGRVALSRVKPVVPALTVTNPGTLSSGTGLVTATLVGMENSVQIYSQTIALDNISGGATASFTFPAYTPTVIGTISWTLDVTDQDPDVDQATGITKVVK